MSYSNKKVANDPSLFPAVQEWMTWTGSLEYRYDAQGGWVPIPDPAAAGKLRHHFNLADARRALRWVGSKSKYRQNPGEFITDWAVYRWNFTASKWDLQYSGLRGEKRDDSLLFKIRFTKDESKHPIDAKQEDAAIESILQSVR